MKPIVITIHDMIFESHPEYFQDIRIISNKNEMINNSSAIISISNYTKEQILRFYPKLDESKIKVIHHGISLNIFLITTCVPLIYLITLHTNLHWTHLALIQRVPMFLFGIYCALNSNKRNYFTHITLLYLMYFIATVIYNPAHIGFLHTTMITPLCIYFIILLSVKIRQAI